jgi:FtsH-binding integral membrane protein
MRARSVAVAALVCVALVALTAWLFRLPLTHAVALAPVIVATAGATAFIVVLWVKVAADALRAQRHPGRILAAGALALGVLVVLSFFVELPAGH